MENKRILIIEDEQDMLGMLNIRLSAHGYNILTASDGNEGLKKAQSENPDLIILDLMLPGIDGYKVCALLKNNTQYKHIPILIFSAKAQKEDVKMGEECGADAYVLKPFDPEVLFEKIEELIGE